MAEISLIDLRQRNVGTCVYTDSTPGEPWE